MAFDTHYNYRFVMLCIPKWYRSISHSVLSTLHCSLLQGGVPQTLLQRFGVAAVRGVARNRGITKFQLEPWRREQNVLDDILAQLTPDKRRKFKVGKDGFDCRSIELCPVGERTTFSLLMQCVCSVSVSQLRGPALLCVDCASPVGGGGPSSHFCTSALCSTQCTCTSPSTAASMPQCSQLRCSYKLYICYYRHPL